jgi:putative ABC transport system permease protein
MGYGRVAMQAYVVMQSAVLTLIGFAVGCVMYLVGSHLFNQMLGEYMKADRFVCRLEPVHFFVALAGALMLAMVVAGVGGVVVTKIEPAESLRDL